MSSTDQHGSSLGSFPTLPSPFIPTLIGLRAFDLVSSPIWWEAATNTKLHLKIEHVSHPTRLEESVNTYNLIYDLTPLKWTNWKCIFDRYYFRSLWIIETYCFGSLRIVETAWKFSSTYNKGVITYLQVTNWFSACRSGYRSLRVEPGPGRSSDLDQDTLRGLVEYNLWKSTQEWTLDFNTS